MGPRPAEAAFTDLYRAHYAAVRSYASVCVPSSEVDDIVADTFVVAWRRFADLPEDWARGWLIGVARNVVRSRHRRSRRALNFVGQLVDLRPDSATMLDGDEMSIEDLDILKTAFASIGEADQEILILAGPYDLSTPEIALALGIKQNAVAVRLHRARARLRAARAEQLPDEDRGA